MEATHSVVRPRDRQMSGARPSAGSLALACSKCHKRPDQTQDSLKFGGNRVIQVSMKTDQAPPEPPQRGDISDWSRRSRRRVFLRASAVTWERWSDSTLFVTLTYPGIPQDGRRCKRHLKRFLQAAERYFDDDLAGGLWKMEFQQRGSAHFHVWLCLESSGIPQERIEAIREWIADTWYHIVGSGLEKHRNAGTSADLLKPTEDPARYLKGYLAKHGKKEYQNSPPPGFVSPGRFWAFFGGITDQWSKPQAVPRRATVRILRLMRRAIRSRTGRKVRARNGLSYVTAHPGGVDQWKRFIDQAIQEETTHDDRLANRGDTDDLRNFGIGDRLRRHALREQERAGPGPRHPRGKPAVDGARLSRRAIRWLGDV